MNQRIKELAKQAELYAFVSDEGIDPDIEKFAQLIVRECADIFFIDECSELGYIGDRIRKHFGVEL